MEVVGESIDFYFYNIFILFYSNYIPFKLPFPIIDGLLHVQCSPVSQCLHFRGSDLSGVSSGRGIWPHYDLMTSLIAVCHGPRAGV